MNGFYVFEIYVFLFFFDRNSEKETERNNIKSKEILAFGLIDKNKDESISKHEMSNMFQKLTKEQVKHFY